MAFEPKRVYQFGPFQLDTGERILKRNGEMVPLTRKAFDTLCLLVENSGCVLQKEEMMNRIWPDSFVEEATLAQNVFTLRRVLGESPTEAQYIETVPRRGYRFIAKVSVVVPDSGEQGEQGRNGPTAKSLAVLPFKTLTPERGNEYFGLGMADALITKLCNVREIVVRPTSAVLKYHRQDHDLYTAGRELKAQLVLDGAIQRLDDRIRITVQLVNLESGAPLWADKFDERFSDVFSLQDTISELVVEALTLELTNAQKSKLKKKHTKNSEAYRSYLQGRYLWSKWTEDGFLKSIEAFQRAIETEPGYALPYAGLADAYSSLAFYGYMKPSEAMPKVKEMALRALRIDDQLAEARLPLAAALFFYDWDWVEAEREFEWIIQASPASAIAHQLHGLLLIAMNRLDEATSRLRQALELDPFSPLIKTTAGFPYYYSRRYDDAIELYRQIIDEDPHFGLAHVALGEVYAQIGRYEQAIDHYKVAIASWGEKPVLPYLGHAYAASQQKDKAIEIIRRLEEMSAREFISPFSLAVVYAGLDARDELFEALEKAYHGRSNRLVFLSVHPIFEPFHSDPRFAAIIKRIGLEPGGP